AGSDCRRGQGALADKVRHAPVAAILVAAAGIIVAAAIVTAPIAAGHLHFSSEWFRSRFGSTNESALPFAVRAAQTARSCPEAASGPAGQAVASWSSRCSALDARYSPGCSTLSCSTTPSLTSIE